MWSWQWHNSYLLRAGENLCNSGDTAIRWLFIERKLFIWNGCNKFFHLWLFRSVIQRIRRFVKSWKRRSGMNWWPRGRGSMFYSLWKLAASGKVHNMTAAQMQTWRSSSSSQRVSWIHLLLRKNSRYRNVAKKEQKISRVRREGLNNCIYALLYSSFEIFLFF